MSINLRLQNTCVLIVRSKKQSAGRQGHFTLIFGIYKKKNLSKWLLSIKPCQKKVKNLIFFFSFLKKALFKRFYI